MFNGVNHGDTLGKGQYGAYTSFVKKLCDDTGEI